MTREGTIARCKFLSRTHGELELEDGIRLALMGAALKQFARDVIGLPELPTELDRLDYVAERCRGMRIRYRCTPPRAQLQGCENLGRAS